MLKVTENKKYFEYIIAHLRQEDLLEVKALWRDNWQKELLKTLKNQKTLVLFSQGNPIAMGGFVPVKCKGLKMAVVWLLCSSLVSKNKSLLYKTMINEIKNAEKKYDVMFNYIYKSNFEAKNWLKKLGFKFDKPKLVGLNIKEGFEFFYKVKKGVNI